MSKKVLPIDEHLSKIKELLKIRKNLIVDASPGSGKTTRVPPFLMELCQGEVLVLEPRRIAARMSAQRVADEIGERLGERVGYQIRFESRVGPRTRLKFLTEGLLIRRLLSDPELRGVDFVVLDEFHERHLHTDVAISFLRHLQKTRRPDLQIVVMSATLDVDRTSAFLDTGNLLQVHAHLYPVTVQQLPQPMFRRLEDEIAAVVRNCTSRPGDILVFLPGRREISNCLEALQNMKLHGVEVLPLHGELSIEEQVAVLEPKNGKRRVILSTNIAETSLTIEGISQVIDSGLHRQARFSHWSGVPTLETRAISRASAIQRAGRAGRLGPGHCFRLYTQGDFSSRLEFEKPEVLRADLTGPLLELAAMGWNLNEKFDWFENPEEGAMSAAKLVLEMTGAIAEGRITQMGRQMAQLPVPPRLARVAIGAHELGVWSEISEILAGLAEGEISRIDIREAMGDRVSERVRRISELLDSMLGNGSGGDVRGTGSDVQVAVMRAFFAGYADRVGRVRRVTKDAAEITMSFGGAVEAPRSSSIATKTDELVMVLEAFEAKSKGSTPKASVLCPIDENILMEKCSTFEEVSWNPSSKRLEAISGLRYGQLDLMSDRGRPAPSSAAVEVFLREGLGVADGDRDDRLRLFQSLQRAFDVTALREELARLEFALSGGPIEGFVLKESGEDHWLKKIAWGCVSLEDFLGRRLLDSQLEDLDFALAQKIRDEVEARAPTHLQLGGRRKAQVHYEFDKPPWLESRIQDFFGMKQGPSVMRGQVPIVLHLLAPNMRAVQVTQDLAGFWERHYPQIKIELKRRYPKHRWD